MLSFIQRIFSPSKKEVPLFSQPTATPAEAVTMPTVEVARLKLSAILERFPEELKPLVLKLPEDTVTVALPVSTIVKQLATGAVKVSLATVHRQAPAGVLGPLPPGDKRLVDVPLGEVFRHVNPHVLKRRSDQRTAEGLGSEFNLFGNAERPYEIAPTAPEEMEETALPAIDTAPAMPAFVPPPPIAPAPSPVVDLSLDDEDAPEETEAPLPAPRTIAPPPDLFPKRAVTPAPSSSVESSEPPPPLKLATPPPAIVTPPETAPTSEPAAADAAIAIPLAQLSAGWPDAIREELAPLNGSAQVALPTAQVTAGLARGRITFTWGQIRSWLEPQLEQPSRQDDSTELTLPLKVVAPVFLVAAKRPKAPAPTGFETDIPALFNDRRTTPAPAEPEAAPPPPEPIVEAHAAPAPVVTHHPTTVGELFGNPNKTEWTPAELVAALAKRPGVSGAVVALQEGLLVAHSLPADVKSEIIAAFLPQIFARLNQYSGEMKLGEVDDLLFTTHGAHCQIYRLGFVYFAVLGKPGETLPWPELRLVADELTRQTQPKS